MGNPQSPSPTASNGHGRAASGKFAAGNGFAKGNPYARRVGELRAALIEAVTEEDIQAVARALVTAAKTGEVAAIRELLDRCIGKAAEGADLLERIQALEAVIESRGPVPPSSFDPMHFVLPPRLDKEVE